MRLTNSRVKNDLTLVSEKFTRSLLDDPAHAAVTFLSEDITNGTYLGAVEGGVGGWWSRFCLAKLSFGQTRPYH